MIREFKIYYGTFTFVLKINNTLAEFFYTVIHELQYIKDIKYLYFTHGLLSFYM